MPKADVGPGSEEWHPYNTKNVMTLRESGVLPLGGLLSEVFPSLLAGHLMLLASLSAYAETQRNPHQRALFVKAHPCPASGKTRGACPGYVVDHIKPLCAGGADHPRNMQWQTVAEAKQKDRLEAEECRAYRRQR